MYFKKAIQAVGHTPLIELPRLSPNKKVKILAKVEGQNPGGSASIKDRIARYMIAKAEQSGKLTKDQTIIEATSGNTGIALAWIGNQLGYPVTIVMPDSMSQERQLLLKIHNARLILTKGSYGMQAAIDTARELAAGDNKYYMPDQFTNPLNPLTHYETTALEIIKDFPYDRIDVMVAGIGTGGTLMGVSRRLKERFPNIKVIGVEPAPGDIIQGLKCLGDNIPPFWDNRLIDDKIAVTTQQAETAAMRLLDGEGIFAGSSSGAAVHQAIKIAREIREGNIVVVLPDGGWKYLSLDFWTKPDRNE